MERPRQKDEKDQKLKRWRQGEARQKAVKKTKLKRNWSGKKRAFW